MNNQDLKSKVGVVVIGRNEGERLQVCLASLSQFGMPVVYVDSGSTDDSVALATSFNAHVLNLDLTVPFTAARARNEGFAKLTEVAPHVSFVQFVDGDCEVVSTWLLAALTTLQQNDRLAVVCGRRKERYPNHTFYNFMCDLEWNTPVGEAKACGGDALMRVTAFQAVNGFNTTLIAGEEPELCVRLRANGWGIQRIAQDMTIHDAAMTRFSQWWKRTVRAGHAFAEGAFMHGKSPARHWVQEARRPWIWAMLIPLVIIIVSVINLQLGVLVGLIYPLQWLRLAHRQRAYGWGRALKLSTYALLGKFAELQGQLSFHYNRLFKKKSQLIEYK